MFSHEALSVDTSLRQRELLQEAEHAALVALAVAHARATGARAPSSVLSKVRAGLSALISKRPTATREHEVEHGHAIA
jgi:hypothetical protein